MFLRGCQAISLFSLVLVVKSSDLSDKEKNTVILLFQDVSPPNWNTGNKTGLLQEITLDAVNVFCANNPSRCALNFWNDSRKFNIKHVIVAEAPKQKEKDIQVKLFVSLPDGSDIRKDSHSVIPGPILREILQAHEHNMTAVVGAEIKSISVESDSEESSTTDNKMNYIMIPISFTVLIVLCFVACCLHCASKRRQKAIDVERRKQTLRNQRGNSSKPSASNSNQGRVPTQNTAGENVSISIIHEERRKKRKKKHKTERPYVDSDQQEQLENGESRDLARKRKKKTKHSRHQRLEGHLTLEPAVQDGQWEDGERERVPTPMPVLRGLNTNRDPVESFEMKPRERKRKRKKKQKRTHSELKEYDEGFDEGSETRQAGNSEDSLLKSLPRPRQLAPLQERSPPTVQL